MTMKTFIAALAVGSCGVAAVALKGAPDWASMAAGFIMFNQVIWSGK